MSGQQQRCHACFILSSIHIGLEKTAGHLDGIDNFGTRGKVSRQRRADDNRGDVLTVFGEQPEFVQRSSLKQLRITWMSHDTTHVSAQCQQSTLPVFRILKDVHEERKPCGLFQPPGKACIPCGQLSLQSSESFFKSSLAVIFVSTGGCFPLKPIFQLLAVSNNLHLQIGAKLFHAGQLLFAGQFTLSREAGDLQLPQSFVIQPAFVGGQSPAIRHVVHDFCTPGDRRQDFQ